MRIERTKENLLQLDDSYAHEKLRFAPSKLYSVLSEYENLVIDFKKEKINPESTNIHSQLQKVMDNLAYCNVDGEIFDERDTQYFDIDLYLKCLDASSEKLKSLVDQVKKFGCLG